MSQSQTSERAGDEQQAVAALYRIARGSGDPDSELSALRPVAGADYASALRLQLGVLDRWLADGEELGGWKIGLTSRDARDSMGVGLRPHGYVLARRVLQSGARLPAGIAGVRLEAEIGVVLGKDLAGEDVSVGQARDAVAGVAPAFEINARRVPERAPLAARLGNALNNWGVVFGSVLAPEQIELAAVRVEISGPDGVLDRGTAEPAVLDDPYLSLTRICRSLALNGRGLLAGQRLITGSLTPPVTVSVPGRYQADFGELGSVAVVVPG